MTAPTTNAQLVAHAGKLLFGDNWQQPTARLLGWPIDDRGQNRTVQRIKAAAEKGEDYRISPGVLDELAGALQARSDQAARMARTLKEAAERP